MSHRAPSPRSTRSRWIRVLLPAVLVLLWLVGAAVGGPFFGRVGEVSSNDQTNYLPDSADATVVQAALSDFTESDSLPAVLVFTAEETLTESQLAGVEDSIARVAELDGVLEGASPVIPSEDGLAAQAFVPLDADAETGDVVESVSTTLQESTPAGVSSFVTGPAGFGADLGAAFAGIDGLLLVVALVAVFIILVFVYRSFLLPVAVLATSMFALTVALLVIWWLAAAGVLLLSGQTQGILFILVIGAATDYSLLYVARYREELRRRESAWEASVKALRRSVEPILASGSTVIAGLLCLLLSDLKSNSTLGPVAAIGIVFAMLSALTLLPSILVAFGRAAFWPRRPRFEPEVVAAEGGVAPESWWTRIARQVRRRPRRIWIGTTVLLAVGAAGVLQLDAQGVPQSELVLAQSDARDGQQALGEHFPGGSGSPAYLLADERDLDVVVETLLQEPGISSAAITAEDSPSGTAPVSAEGVQPVGPPGTSAPEPTVVQGRVLLQATLSDAADSDAAQQAVRDLRASLAGVEDRLQEPVLVGGVTATAIDTNDASVHDRTLIIPLVLVVILAILMLLLRSVLAPVLLVATTVLSFGTALGVAALVFNHLFGFPGADPAVPLYAFVFLVALGIDYNIFLMTRVREESLHHGTQEGVFRGLAVTGGVITSAGLVLAATFAALSVIPILFLVQIAFIVAFGVLLDTFLVRALLVPALCTHIGPRIWWPSALGREQHSPVEPATQPETQAVRGTG
ncbi:MAG: MMPL family transporter [Micrococcaceae bacterium]